MPRCRCAGSVLTAVTTRSALIPLVMNVFEPSTTYTSPSRRAVVRIPARSEPIPGSVMATAVIELAGRDAGQPARLLLVGGEGRGSTAGTMSLCRPSPRPKPVAPTRAVSSPITTLKRKSSTPPPPYSSGIAIPTKPLAPAAANTSRGHDPVALPLVVVGYDLLLQEAPEAVPERLVLVVEQLAAHASVPSTAGLRTPARGVGADGTEAGWWPAPSLPTRAPARRPSEARPS